MSCTPPVKLSISASTALAIVVVFPATFLSATLSYRIVEAPLIQWSRRVGR
jgi:peptidoglycan/LPS O-acetylase OafA/YrhL